MTVPEPAHQAGGVFIALGAVGGALIGAIAGEPSIGLLAGLALGVAMAAMLWWNGRRG